VLLDLSMPDMDGFEAIPEIRRGDPDVAIIVLSGFSADRMGARALERGADGYVEKGTPIQELREATRVAVAARRGE
jgi:DNA-binding NarL/FixJ family response regulator